MITEFQVQAGALIYFTDGARTLKRSARCVGLLPELFLSVFWCYTVVIFLSMRYPSGFPHCRRLENAVSVSDVCTDYGSFEVERQREPIENENTVSSITPSASLAVPMIR